MKKIIFMTTLIVSAYSFSSCSKNEECKCVGAAPITEDGCDCDVNDACNDLKALGQDCKVE
ncbi:MAG: hypothetical protein CVT95_06385 [Bacteroidetes bacterium HGW-Bacteroidetes-12]|nr:MAG: hypothetical protein CVT95_06385 [Bacteroidetes bacterium HGW-Bacteroidetes-12]